MQSCFVDRFFPFTSHLSYRYSASSSHRRVLRATVNFTMTILGTVELTNQVSEASRDEGEGDDSPDVEGNVETVEDTVETVR